MNEFAQALVNAGTLIIGFDADFLAIVGLSLRVSLTAVLIACAIGFPFGAALALSRFRGRGVAIARLPLLVSSAIAVVMTRVTLSMLPPTIMTAPTSAIARPNPASAVVVNEYRPSHSKVPIVSARLAPIWLISLP